jgi:hypothetical protein
MHRYGCQEVCGGLKHKASIKKILEGGRSQKEEGA